MKFREQVFRIITLNKILVFAGVGMILFSAYKNWNFIAYKFLHLNEIDRSQVESIVFIENEVLAVDVLSRRTQNCWYENNYDITILANELGSANTPYVQAFNFQDITPEGIRIVVPAEKSFEVQSSKFPLSANYTMNESQIFFSVQRPPVTANVVFNKLISIPADNAKETKSCCADGADSGEHNNAHNCLNLSPNFSAAPAFRGYTHFDWQEWFELENLAIHNLPDPFPQKNRKSYRLNLNLQNKKLRDFRILFTDVKLGRKLDDIVLLNNPEGFHPYLDVHAAEYKNFKPDDKLSLQFDFSIISPDSALIELFRLIEIETSLTEMFYPEAEMPDFENISYTSSARLVFRFDVKLPTT